ncbi:YjeF family domain-containing protein [Enterococcus sp. DIV0212c]|uniref:NAD(P)H-hydrate dehydratase n=1 Tax=Enterococcus sp. DIV0212c TaxID=2230867 RepID=UPI001A9B1768|nr:NAD(P)H-hydrate dehydratase [Enterococcus sp. DIV0212c]MBO1353160.1 NAD(P)H-hydrate dehydratase [Enterococcus sp. DIV0212c]
MKELSQENLTTVIKSRPQNSHKGTFGRAVLIGGNETYGGAIIMSAEACVKAGCGLTSVITAEKNHTAVHARLPEAMVLDWTTTQEFSDLIDTADVILVGPGLGLDTHSQQVLEKVLRQQKPEQWLVIDGSAITLFAQNHYALNYPKQVVFTPHQMEWERLSGLTIANQTIENNRAAQKQLNTSIVLKSHRTEIYTASSQYRNPLGTPAMATGGMGDTLAGMITGFLAQFQNKEAALCAAVYLHSLIGEELGKENYVVLPTEISKNLPHYMKRFERLNNKTEEK